MICPICKREMKKGSSVCEFCGYRQVRYCKICGRMLKNGQTVCPACEAEKLEAELAKMMPEEQVPEVPSLEEPEEIPEMIEEVPEEETPEPEVLAEEPAEKEIPELPEDPDEDLSLEELYERAIAGKLLMEEEEVFAESLLEEEPVEESAEEIPAEEPAEDIPAEEFVEEVPVEELFEEIPVEAIEEEETELEEPQEEELEELPPLVFPAELFSDMPFEEEAAEEPAAEIEEIAVDKFTSEEISVEEAEPEVAAEEPEEELELFSVERPKELEVFTVIDGEFPEEPAEEIFEDESADEFYEEGPEEDFSEEEEEPEAKPVRPIVKREEEPKKKKPPILLWLIILLVLIIGGIAAFSMLWGNDHPSETPAPPEESSTEETTPEETTHEETTPEETTPEETTPEETTEPETTVPPTDPYEACVLKGVLTYSNRKYGIRITEGTPFTFVDNRKNVLGISEITFAGDEEYYGYINQNVTITGDIGMVDGVPYLYVGDFACKQDQNFVYSERVIHRYEFVRADVTYEQAAAEAAARGGYLARITTEDEFAHVTAQISAQGLSNVRFFVGGTRLEGTQDYYWTYPDGTFTGDLIDDPYSWSGEKWAGGGPSFSDQGRAETAVVLFHYDEESRYAFNDVGRDYLQYDYYYCGYAGYIIEYEN